MSDPPGLPSALGIEAVETIPEGNSLTVRVTGRWRRRRPEWRGPAILVVEAHGTRYRFPAMPEPPSVMGTMPGTWRMTFSVAPELGPHLSGRSWLQLGSLIAPLPVFAQTKIGGPSEGEGATAVADTPEPEGLPERRRPGELAIEHARRRADDAEALAAELALRVDQLERALEEARAQPARLERARRAAEQGAHAEAARRAELEEQLAEQERALEEARARAAALARRVEELEHELRRLRRTADEAVHLAAGERAARLRAERLAAEERPAPVAADVVAARVSAARKAVLAAEQAQVRRTVKDAGVRRVAPRLARPESRAAEDELHMRARRDAGLVERERARRVEAEARAAELERTLAARTDRWARAYSEINQIRDEIGELRRVFAHIESAPPPAPEPAAPVQADRLTEALTRLRERSEPAEEEPLPAPVEPETLQVAPATSARDRYVAPTGSTSTPPPPASPAAAPIAPAESVSPPPAPSTSIPPPAPSAPPDPPGPPGPSAPAAAPVPPATQAATRAWLWPIFRSLAREDSLFAGQLILHLLPAWREVHPLPVAFDLILGDRACVQVTVGAGGVDVRHSEAPRRPGDVHFQVNGDLERLGRTVAAGRMRRRLARGMSRVSGDQEAFGRTALLVRAPLTLAQLHEAGVRLDPVLAFRLAARMIDPAWTVGHRFTIAHRLPAMATADAHLVVTDGGPVSVGEGPSGGPADATIVAPADAFPGALAAPSSQVEGRPEPLVQLAAWLERAQSG